MKKKFLMGLAIGFLMFVMVGFANAALVSGDFRTESDLPDYSTAGPLVYQRLGAIIDGGVELTEANFVANPSSWAGGLVYMDYNPVTNILKLDSQDDLDFQTFGAWIDNIVFDGAESITGVTILSNGITNPTFDPTFSFTANSIHIGWDFRPSVFDFTGGISEFQITTSSVPVPEPATMLLLGLGLIGLAGVRRKFKK